MQTKQVMVIEEHAISPEDIRKIEALDVLVVTKRPGLGIEMYYIDLPERVKENAFEAKE